MRTAIDKYCIDSDFLLAEEGDVCGKFNSSESCLQIDEHEEIVKNITTTIRKLALVPVQKWIPLLGSNWWEDLIKGKGWKKLVFVGGCALISVVLDPCMLPCLIQLINKTVQKSLEQMTPEKLIVLMAQPAEENEMNTKEMYKKYQKLRKIYKDLEDKVEWE